MSPSGGRAIVASLAALALIMLLALTGPRPDTEYAGVARRLGGACLQLERWDLFGWNPIGQTHSIADTSAGRWHPPVDDPPCSVIDDGQILVRLPADAPHDAYRLCGLADDRPCVEFRRVPFEGTPGP